MYNVNRSFFDKEGAMKVVLANPPSVIGQSFSDGCYAPRGIWSLATSLKANFPAMEIIHLSRLSDEVLNKANEHGD